jgi:hypothetical protein
MSGLTVPAVFKRRLWKTRSGGKPARSQKYFAVGPALAVKYA